MTRQQALERLRAQIDEASPIIGAGAGTAVGLATVLLTRGREVELRQGSTIDVVFDRPIPVD